MMLGGQTTAQAATSAAPAAPAQSQAQSSHTLSDQAVCDRGPWGARVQGRPVAFDGGDRGGDYLWHDSTGFHLRVTHKGDDRAVYTGTLHSQDPMWIDPFHLEGADYVALSADRRTLTFRFADYGHIDGVDFHAGCSPTLTATELRVGGDLLPAGRVNLGATMRHPEQVPFTVHRQR
jgi:hypothetical protein